jgi:hypothetical protein
MGTYTTNEGRDEGDTCLSASDSLAETEKKGQVAVDVVITLEFTSSLDTLPRRCDFDENTLLFDTNRLVEGNELLSLRIDKNKEPIKLCDNITYLGLGALLVEGETSIDFRRHTARNDSKNLLAKLDKLIIDIDQ